MSEAVTTLYRPVGRTELDLIREAGNRSFPPRLPGQPYFYPVLNEDYATQIAQDWNTKDQASGYEGYVLKFNIRTDFLDQYDVHVVGDSHHREFWIPAADIESFNANIRGSIQILRKFSAGKLNPSR